MGPDDYGARICACLSLIACTAIVGDVVGWLAYQLMSDAWRASYLFISDHKEVLTVVGILLGAIAAMWGAIATTILAVRALRKGPS